MSWLKLSEISNMISGVLYGDDVSVRGVSIDSRTLQHQELFIALQGEQFDGHRFAQQAQAAGAAGVLSARRLEVSIPQIVVQDTFRALWDFARAWRNYLRLQIIALTGSNGKTTTKEMLFSIFKAEKESLATRGNLNNHIGVPLTLLRLREQHEVGIIEIGANHAGEVRKSTQLVKPDIGLVTNAASAHLEGFGSVSGVAEAKGELFETLPASAVAVVNADSPYCDYWRGLLKEQRVVSFGLDKAAEVQGQFNHQTASFTLAGETHVVHLKVPGHHNFQNALAATAVAYSAGLETSAIITGLESFTALTGRLSFLSGINGACLIDDSYNANPSSLQAALDVLCSDPGEPWLVLGDMQELGSRATALHTDAGRIAKATGVQRLFTVGTLAQAAADSFGKSAQHFETMDALIKHLLPQMKTGITVLVKGSRSARLEKVISALIDREKQC